METSFQGIKIASSEETGKMNGLPCVWQQDVGGTSAYTLLPDTQAVSLRVGFAIQL